MMEKKYELVNYNEKTGLWQIRALRSFNDVKAGDLGGWIEKEFNLSHIGDCWVYDNARVFDNAEVYGNARVYGCYARVCGNAKVFDDATVFDDARVYGDATVCGDAMIFNNAKVYGDAKVSGNAKVYGDARVFENAEVYGDAEVYNNARVFENARVFGKARVYGNAKVYGNVMIYGDAKVGEHNYVQHSKLDCDITDGKNKIQSIQCQTNLPIINKEVYCCKVVRDDLTSLHDSDFQYKIGEWVSVAHYDNDPTVSCGRGLHFSHLTYWENRGSSKVLYCKIPLKDVIAVQEGKIRAKRAFVIGVCDNKVY